MGFQVFSSEGWDGQGALAEDTAWARARRGARVLHLSIQAIGRERIWGRRRKWPQDGKVPRHGEQEWRSSREVLEAVSGDGRVNLERCEHTRVSEVKS